MISKNINIFEQTWTNEQTVSSLLLFCLTKKCFQKRQASDPACCPSLAASQLGSRLAELAVPTSGSSKVERVDVVPRRFPKMVGFMLFLQKWWDSEFQRWLKDQWLTVRWFKWTSIGWFEFQLYVLVALVILTESCFRQPKCRKKRTKMISCCSVRLFFSYVFNGNVRSTY